jgi:predicted TIM-barrel fold metal-dependent hydrolase
MMPGLSTAALLGLVLGLGACRRPAPAPPPRNDGSAATSQPARSLASPPFRPSALPRIDVHTHVAPAGMEHALAMLGSQRIVHFVNLSGGAPGRGLEEQLAAARATGGRVTTFTTPDWREARRPGYGPRLAAQIERARSLGARGIKISKGLGLGYTGPDGALLAIDDPGLDPLFAKAGELGLPVAIHSGDPKAFWLPPTPVNERYEELVVHPGWSFYGQPVPSWQALFDQFTRRIARHPKTLFIGVHFGNDPEDPDKVAELLERYPNLYIDTAARIPEIGRHDAARMRAFFIRFQDRILFGTDAGFGERPEELMLGSSGADPPTPAEITRFWDATWRYFETDERQMEHPTPVQGRWRIDGLALPESVLAKVYAGNARRILGLTIP